MSTFGKKFGDFITSINSLKANDKTGIQNSMIILILFSKSLNTYISINKDIFTTMNYPVALFGNSVGDFITNINSLNTDYKFGIQNLMIILTLLSKFVYRYMSLNKDFFKKINYPAVNIYYIYR